VPSFSEQCYVSLGQLRALPLCRRRAIARSSFQIPDSLGPSGFNRSKSDFDRNSSAYGKPLEWRSCPFLRVVRPCYQHCGFHNPSKNMKIFETIEITLKRAMAKIGYSGAKIELGNATFLLSSSRQFCSPQIHENARVSAEKKIYTCITLCRPPLEVPLT
jgi:hypothetical protein